MTYAQERSAALKAQGKCVQCGPTVDAEAGHTLCAKCLQTLRDIATRRRLEKVAKGECRQDGCAQARVPGKTHCLACLEERRAKSCRICGSDEHRFYPTTEHKSHRELGLCRQCGKPSVSGIASVLACEDHMPAVRVRWAKTHKKLRDRRKGAGACIRCKAPIAAGSKSRCAACLEKAKEDERGRKAAKKLLEGEEA